MRGTLKDTGKQPTGSRTGGPNTRAHTRTHARTHARTTPTGQASSQGPSLLALPEPQARARVRWSALFCFVRALGTCGDLSSSVRRIWVWRTRWRERLAQYLFAGLSEDLRVTEAEVTVSVYSGDSHAVGMPREMPREAVL